MNTLEKTNHKTNEVLELFEVLVKRRAEFYSLYSKKSFIRYYTKDDMLGVVICDDEIRLLNEKGWPFANIEFNYESYAGSIQPQFFEFDANTSDTLFQLYLSFHAQISGEDVLVVYDTIDKTIMFESDVLEFNSAVKYPFGTQEDQEEILFKLNLEFENAITYAELQSALASIEKFKSYDLPKSSNVQIWSYQFPMNLKELLENI